MREEGSLREGLLASERQQREWERKERQERQERPRKAKGKTQNPRMVTPDRKVCSEVGHFARECPKKKEASNASSSGGGDVHCLTYTDDQSHWIMMLAEVGQNQEQSNNIEFLVDFGSACHAWPCKTKPCSTHGGTCLTATRAPVASQISIVGRAWCGNQCESHVRIASCPLFNPGCESSC